MTRTRLLQLIIANFGYKTYLEIGCHNNEHNFNHIPADYKVGVDPNSGGTLKMTSDEFFLQNKETFDIIFIDGLHLSWQVDKDIENALKILNKNGTIVMHDCCPMKEEIQVDYVKDGEWTGDVWKSFVKKRACQDVDMAVGNFDYGCGVIRVRPNTDLINVANEDLTWENLDTNRQSWLRLMTLEELIRWI